MPSTSRTLTKDANALINKMQSSAEAFVIITYDFEYLFVNAAAERIYKKSSNELIGKKAKDVFPEMWDFGPFKNTQRKVAAHEPLVIRYHSPFANSWVEMSGKPYDNFYTFTYRSIDHKSVLKDELRDQLKKRP